MDAKSGNSALFVGGFSDRGSVADSKGNESTCIRQRTPTGEIYFLNVSTGEKVIAGSRRPDGTMRKDIKVKPGYTPADEQQAFQTRRRLERQRKDEMKTKGGLRSGQRLPPGAEVDESAVEAIGTRKLKARSSHVKKKDEEGRFQIKDDMRFSTKAEVVSVSGVENEFKKCNLESGDIRFTIGSETFLPEITHTTVIKGDVQKRLRSMRKKLREIESLETRLSNDLVLTDDQITKINLKQALKFEIAAAERYNVDS